MSLQLFFRQPFAVESVGDAMGQFDASRQLSRFSIVQDKVTLFLPDIANHGPDVEFVRFRGSGFGNHHRFSTDVSVSI